MDTIHIEGYANELDLTDALSNDYDLDMNFCFDEDSEDSMPNIFLRFYESTKKCTLDKALSGFLHKMYGLLEATGQEYGYSEFTIQGFFLSSLKLGGHDLNKIIKSKGNKYLHILIDQIDDKLIKQ